ncbi:MAG: sugar transferase [Crocinitomicaceae bacterium]|nr:sugar transferase [Crocinitomicaceae bacterium]
MLKRTADILFSLTGLILTLPVQLICVLVSLAADHQNPFFIQTRMGAGKRDFTILKLRTMKNNEITFIGKIFRRTGLDELPQLWNILFGQMSFVGPRPLTKADAERLGWNDQFHAVRWKVKPGLTGLAQLSPVCHRKMSWFFDQKYIQCSSFLLDMKIMISSVLVLFVGKQKAVKWLYSANYERTR